MIWEIGETGKRIWLKPRLVKTFCQFDSDISYQSVQVSVESEVNYHEHCVNSIKMQ